MVTPRFLSLSSVIRSNPLLSGTVLGQLYYGDLVNGQCGDEGVYADGYWWKSVYSYNHGM